MTEEQKPPVFGKLIIALKFIVVTIEFSRLGAGKLL